MRYIKFENKCVSKTHRIPFLTPHLETAKYIATNYIRHTALPGAYPEIWIRGGEGVGSRSLPSPGPPPLPFPSFPSPHLPFPSP